MITRPKILPKQSKLDFTFGLFYKQKNLIINLNLYTQNNKNFTSSIKILKLSAKYFRQFDKHLIDLNLS